MNLPNSPLLLLRVITAGLLTIFVMAGGMVHAQPKQGIPPVQPRIQGVFPAGGKAGSTVEVQVTGQWLESPARLWFSHPGIKAEFLEMVVTKADAQKKGNNNQNPSQTVRFKVTLDSSTALGNHDLRVVNDFGVSNPRAFVVGDQPEVLEKEPNNDVDQAQRIEINHVIHGVLSTPTDVDFYVVSGKKGQRVVVSCLASSIDSKAEPVLYLYGPGGNQLASNHNYSGNDALLDRTLEVDGDYLVRVASFTYTQGGPDYFYRLGIGTNPWIDAVYPPVVIPGSENKVTVIGRNLPGGKLDPGSIINGSTLETLTVSVKSPADPAALEHLEFPGYLPPRSSELDGFPFQVSNAFGKSNQVLLIHGRSPLILDQGDNESKEKAQTIPVPCELVGRIEKPHDRDWYRFAVKKGQKLSIELLGDRLGSRMDLYCTLRSTREKSAIQELDDNPEILHPIQFFTRTEDPQRQRLVADADGEYLIQVSSREADLDFGPRNIYCLRITEEQPDFRLIVMPGNPRDLGAEILRPGGATYLSVFAWRRDGFEDAIALSVEGLPPGVTCPPQFMGPGQKQASLVLLTGEGVKPWNGPIIVKGSARIKNQPVVREARPASITWPVPAQQNFPAISRMDQSLVIAIRGEDSFLVQPEKESIQAMPGDKVTVKFKAERRGDFKAPITLTLANISQNAMTMANGQTLSIPADKKEGSGVLDLKSTLLPGTYTVVFRTTAAVSTSRDGKNKTDVQAQGATRPLTLTIVPRPTKPAK